MKDAVFVNFSNHPSAKWSKEQLAAAEAIGRVEDEPFPAVAADLDEHGVALMAEEATLRILAKKPVAVLCQGDFSLAFAVTERLKAKGVRVLAASSDRVIREMTDQNGDVKKMSVFRFVRFRNY